MPALFVALLICIIRACTLPGAVNGLKYMFVPGWAVANGVIEEAPDFLTVLSTAGGQMFFSLSLGMGAMITYGSYLQKKENLQKNAHVHRRHGYAGGSDGRPVRHARPLRSGSQRRAGRPQAAVHHHAERVRPHGRPWVPIFGIIFYLLVVFAAISSSISLLEAVVAHFVDKAARRRARATSARPTPSSRRPAVGRGLHARLRRRVWARPASPRAISWAMTGDLPHMGGRLAGLLRHAVRGHHDAAGRTADVHHDRLGARPRRRSRDEVRATPGHQP